MAPGRKLKKVCLAYSGGLDTSVILHWLIERFGCEVVAYTADVGQEEELVGLPEKAKATGAFFFRRNEDRSLAWEKYVPSNG